MPVVLACLVVTEGVYVWWFAQVTDGRLPGCAYDDLSIGLRVWRSAVTLNLLKFYLTLAMLRARFNFGAQAGLGHLLFLLPFATCVSMGFWNVVILLVCNRNFAHEGITLKYEPCYTNR